MPRFVNCTPHPITLRRPDGTDETIEPSDWIARVEQVTTTCHDYPNGMIHDMPIKTTGMGRARLPHQVEGCTFIVSAMVAQHDEAKARPDIVAPGTGPDHNPIRNEKGHVVAVTCLVRFD